MELITLHFNLLLFYIELAFGFWIAWIEKKESPKIESFPPLADLALDNIRLYIYIYIVIHRQTVLFYQNSSVWPGSKPIQLYVRLSLRPLSQQADYVG